MPEPESAAQKAQREAMDAERDAEQAAAIIRGKEAAAARTEAEREQRAAEQRYRAELDAELGIPADMDEASKTLARQAYHRNREASRKAGNG